MLGWELSPHHSGGLGVACRGLLTALAKIHPVTFFLPFYPDKERAFRVVSCLSSPAANTYAYSPSHATPLPALSFLFHRVAEFTQRASELARQEEFDIIHAHDWLTFQAGIRIKEETRKPLVAHIHATEFDRTGGNGRNEFVYDAELRGMEGADRVVANSFYIKRIAMEQYGIPEEKIRVVHNAINPLPQSSGVSLPFATDRPLVVFVGRLTIQKGPDIFLRIAKRVLETLPNALFVMAGDGDMREQLIREAIDLGISKNVIFTGFVSDHEIQELVEASTLTVMPSVSEPFGLVALESLAMNTPVIVSRQSGVAEVLSHALKADFWDVEDMAHKILSVIAYPALRKELQTNGKRNALARSWNHAAQDCSDIYQTLAT
ncbi:MAG: glycosyltransferase family 4 protein [bacterium]|nr:glycosyltransferase family 4 protein [bacterium]